MRLCHTLSLMEVLDEVRCFGDMHRIQQGHITIMALLCFRVHGPTTRSFLLEYRGKQEVDPIHLTIRDDSGTRRSIRKPAYLRSRSSKQLKWEMRSNLPLLPQPISNFHQSLPKNVPPPLILLPLRLIPPKPNPPIPIHRTRLHQPLVTRRQQRTPALLDLRKLEPIAVFGNLFHDPPPQLGIVILDLSPQPLRLGRRGGDEDLVGSGGVVHGDGFAPHDVVFVCREADAGVLWVGENGRVPVLQPAFGELELVAVEVEVGWGVVDCRSVGWARGHCSAGSDDEDDGS